MGMNSLLGAKVGDVEPRVELRGMGLPLMWSGAMHGIYYVETDGASTMRSSFFTTFVDFLFTLTPPLRNAWSLKAGLPA